MKLFFGKIAFILGILQLILSCNTTKGLRDQDYLLVKNQVFIDSIKTNKSIYQELLYQKPNAKLIAPLRLHIYNLARPNRDSIFDHWLYKKPKREARWTQLLSKKQLDRLRESVVNFNSWLKKTGEAPVIVDSLRAARSAKRLESYFWNSGWFNARTSYTIAPMGNQKARISYHVTPNQPYIVDTIRTTIASRAADSIYRLHKERSHIVAGTQYSTLDFEKERNRITSLFRNSGLYHFDQDYIKFEADTVNTDRKVNINFVISDRQRTQGEITNSVPFKTHKISKVNIITDQNFGNSKNGFADSLQYANYTLYSYQKLRYRPKALTDAIFIKAGDTYSDIDRTLTYNQVSNLRTFKYPNIRYQEDPNSYHKEALIATVFLTPLKKYALGFDLDLSTSTIQTFGIGFGGSILARNVFKGAEILELSARGSVGSSRDLIEDDSRFLNISEIGSDLKLSFPRILFPSETDWVIPKSMAPQTTISIGLNTQQNIGLDKQNLTGVFNYNWNSSSRSTNQLDLLNVQYVRNLNAQNYFRVYRTSFARLQDLAEIVLAEELLPENGDQFIADAKNGNYDNQLIQEDLQEINNLNERKERLIENNLIFTSNFTYLRNSKENMYDEDFSRLRVKFELAGNFLSAVARVSGLEKNTNDRYSLFGVEFSQYIKTEIGYIKHINLGRKKVLAFRLFGGIAVPYNNSNSIPFSRSFFAGGANDNRGWQAYDLGPGSSGGLNEFNEANLKLAFNLENRFNITGSLYGALFVDIGNIWNVLDNFEQEKEATFDGLQDLEELAVGSGFGLRYDFSFFVLRLDLGFKTYNPALGADKRWFKGYNFSEVVYNIGINYPF